MEIQDTGFIYLPELEMSYEKLRDHLKNLYNLELTQSKEMESTASPEATDLKKNGQLAVSIEDIESPDFISLHSENYDKILQKRENEKDIDAALQELYGEIIAADAIKDKNFIFHLENVILNDDLPADGKIRTLRNTLDLLDANGITLRNKEFMKKLREPAKIDLYEIIDNTRENNLIDVLSDKDARALIQQIQETEIALKTIDPSKEKDRAVLLQEHASLLSDLKSRYNYDWDNNFIEEAPEFIELELEAVPNQEFDPSSHEGSVSIPKHRVKASSIEDAREAVGNFIDKNSLSGANFENAHLYYNGKPIGYITFNRAVYNKDNTIMNYHGGGGVSGVIHEWNQQAAWQMNLLDYSSFAKLPEETKPIEIKYKDGSIKDGVFTDGKFKRADDWNEKYGVVAWRYKAEPQQAAKGTAIKPGKVPTAQEKRFAAYWYKIVNSDKPVEEIVPEKEIDAYLVYVEKMLSRYMKFKTAKEYADSQMGMRYKDFMDRPQVVVETDRDRMEHMWQARHEQSQRHGLLDRFFKN